VQTGSSQPASTLPLHMPTSVRGRTETHHIRGSHTGTIRHKTDATAQHSDLQINKRAVHHPQTGFPREKYRCSARYYSGQNRSPVHHYRRKLRHTHQRPSDPALRCQTTLQRPTRIIPRVCPHTCTNAHSAHGNAEGQPRAHLLGNRWC
jgi:hypothetical protein